MARGVTSKTCESCGASFVAGARAKWCKSCWEACKSASEAVYRTRYNAKPSTREHQREYNRRYREANRDSLREYHVAYYRENRDAAIERGRKYASENKDAVRARKTAWKRSKYSTDMVYRLTEVARANVRGAFARHGYRKNTKTADILGCSWDHLLAHLASLCYGGMTVEDILAADGRVHIDHIVPLATAKTEDDVILLNHYTNLQPLWAADNLEKSDRLDWVHPRDR